MSDYLLLAQQQLSYNRDHSTSHTQALPLDYTIFINGWADNEKWNNFMNTKYSRTPYTLANDLIESNKFKEFHFQYFKASPLDWEILNDLMKCFEWFKVFSNQNDATKGFGVIFHPNMLPTIPIQDYVKHLVLGTKPSVPNQTSQNFIGKLVHHDKVNKTIGFLPINLDGVTDHHPLINIAYKTSSFFSRCQSNGFIEHSPTYFNEECYMLIELDNFGLLHAIKALSCDEHCSWNTFKKIEMTLDKQHNPYYIEDNELFVIKNIPPYYYQDY